MEFIAAIAIVSFIGYYLLAPRPKVQIDSKPGAITAPMCEEGANIPVVFGTVPLRESNVVWWGDLRIVKPENWPVQYHISIHMALCHGEIDGVQQVFAGEKPLIVEPLFGNQSYKIDKYYAFGGPLQGGGIVGEAYFDMGGMCQVNGKNAGEYGIAAASNGEEDKKGPGYFGIATVEIKDCYVGTNPNINPLSFVVQRILKARCGREAQWMPHLAAIGHGCTAEKAWEVCFGNSTSEPSGTDIDALRVWLAEHMPDDDEYISGTPEGIGALMMPAGSEGVSVPAGLSAPIIPWDDSAHVWFRQTVNIDRENTGKPLYLYVYSTRNVHVWIDGYYQGKNDPDVDGGAVNLPFVGAPVEADRLYKKVGGAGKHIVQIYAVDPNDNEEGHYIYARVVTTPVLANQIDAATLYNRKDMNLAHIVRECLTDDIWGLAQPTGKIGTSFYETAQTLYAEGMGASLAWTKQTTIKEFINKVLELMNGNLIQDRYTGQWELTLVRDDYKKEDLLVIDDDWIVSIEGIQRRALGNLTSQVVVNYTSSILGDTASVTAMDPGLVQAQGGITSETRDYAGITTHALASRIAVRDLKVLATPSVACTFTAGRKASRLQPGQAFVLNKPSHGILSQVMRVAEVELGDGRTNTVRVKCVSDVFTAGDFVLSEPEGSPQSDPTDTPIEVIEKPTGVSPGESYKSTFIAARLSDTALKQEVDAICNNGYGCGTTLFEGMGWTQIHPGEWEAPVEGSLELSKMLGGATAYVGQRLLAMSFASLPPGQWRYTGIYEVLDKGYQIISGQYITTKCRVRRAADMDTSADVAHGCVVHVRDTSHWFVLTNTPGSVVLNTTELTWEDRSSYTPTQTVDKLINAATAQEADGVGSSLNLSATAAEPSTWIAFKTGAFPASAMPAGAFRFDVEAFILAGEPFSNTRFECQLCKDDDPDNPTVLATRETDPIRSTVAVTVSGLTRTEAAQDMLGEGLVYRFRLLTDNVDQTVVTVSWGGAKYPTRVYTPLSVLAGITNDAIKEALGAFGPTSPRNTLKIAQKLTADGFATVEMDVNGAASFDFGGGVASTTTVARALASKEIDISSYPEDATFDLKVTGMGTCALLVSVVDVTAGETVATATVEASAVLSTVTETCALYHDAAHRYEVRFYASVEHAIAYLSSALITLHVTE